MGEEIKRRELEILWNPRQVAEYLGLHPHTVYNWISNKRMFDPDKIIHFSNRVRIPRSEVERLAGNIRKKLEDK